MVKAEVEAEEAVAVVVVMEVVAATQCIERPRLPSPWRSIIFNSGGLAAPGCPLLCVNPGAAFAHHRLAGGGSGAGALVHILSGGGSGACGLPGSLYGGGHPGLPYSHATPGG